MAEEVTLGDVDLTTVRARTLSGIVTLVSRSFVLQFVATGGFLLLSIFLGRPEIGLFIAVNDLVSILGYFSDIGLAASLVQKKEKVTLNDLRTTFTLQQAIVIVLIITAFIGSSWLFSYYNIVGDGVWLFYALLVAFFLASLKTIPSVILERQVNFQVIASVEVIETLVFYGVAVLLAWQGSGVLAYAWAVLIRGVVGTAMIYLLSPWKIGFAVSRSSLKSLLGFGLPYQFNSLLAVVKDRFVNIILWRIIGADGVGIIGWAQTWAQKPLRFLMDNVTRVTFPSFSRLQDHPEELKRSIERTLFFISLVTFPTLAGIAMVAPELVLIIPRYSKWQVGLLPLSLFCFSAAWACVSTPLTNTLNAMGRVKTNSYLMLMWTVLTWSLTPWLASRYGFLGVACAAAIISFSSVVPIIIVKRLTKFSLKESVLKPLIATCVMMLVLSFTPNLVLKIAVGILSFGITIYLLVGKSLIIDSTKLLYAFRKK